MTNPIVAADVLTALHRRWSAFEVSLRKSLQHAIELGQSLIKAKASVAHGEFGRLFADHSDPVDGALPFTARWAQRLMRIAGNKAIANAKHASHLPADIDSVAELSMLPADQLEAAIVDGRVTPTTTRDEARSLRKPKPRIKVEQPKAKRMTTSVAKAKDDIDDDFDLFATKLWDAIDRDAALREHIVTSLKLLVQQIEPAAGKPQPAPKANSPEASEPVEILSNNMDDIWPADAGKVIAGYYHQAGVWCVEAVGRQTGAMRMCYLRAKGFASEAAAKGYLEQFDGITKIARGQP